MKDLTARINDLKIKSVEQGQKRQVLKEELASVLKRLAVATQDLEPEILVHYQQHDVVLLDGVTVGGRDRYVITGIPGLFGCDLADSYFDFPGEVLNFCDKVDLDCATTETLEKALREIEAAI